MNVINEVFDNLLGKIPCHNTISNWVKKCGFDAYQKSGELLQGTDYAKIIDESMMIGEEKLLLTIGVPAEHQGHPLECSDANVLDVAVAKSWNGEKVKEQLKKAEEKVGHQPHYVISDNASILKKGIREAHMNHHRDISHSLGMYLERTYKDEIDFKGYTKSMSDAKAKCSMTHEAYLLPPNQRTIARFINLSSWVKWSEQMLRIYHTLSDKEKSVFSFVPANASLIFELYEVMECIQKIEYICKNEGLSQSSVQECQNITRTILFKGNMRMVKLGEYIKTFLEEEAKLVGEKLIAHNNSSDIIESLFGNIKNVNLQINYME